MSWGENAQMLVSNAKDRENNRLRAENERLRAALREIELHTPGPIACAGIAKSSRFAAQCLDDIREIVQAALGNG
jgi:hypothetical protein